MAKRAKGILYMYRRLQWVGKKKKGDKLMYAAYQTSKCITWLIILYTYVYRTSYVYAEKWLADHRWWWWWWCVWVRSEEATVCVIIWQSYIAAEWISDPVSCVCGNVLSIGTSHRTGDNGLDRTTCAVAESMFMYAEWWWIYHSPIIK